MNKLPIVLIGGGGHCKSCIEVIESTGSFEIVHIVDLPGKKNNSILGYPIDYCDDDLPHLSMNHSLHYLITIGQTITAQPRKQAFMRLKELGVKMPAIISSKSIVSRRATIGEGTIVMHAAVVNADVKVGCNTIINNNVNLEHDTVVGNHTHLATNAVVNGNCVIGNEVLIGSNSVILQGITIADKVIVGAGSVVTKNITGPGTYFGNPARKIK